MPFDGNWDTGVDSKNFGKIFFQTYFTIEPLLIPSLCKCIKQEQVLFEFCQWKCSVSVLEFIIIFQFWNSSFNLQMLYIIQSKFVMKAMLVLEKEILQVFVFSKAEI
jgi:hypothetical protein